MSDGPTWQGRAIEQLGKLFLDDADARAFVLTGSLAGADGEVDEWSDLDAKVVLADQAVDRYYLSAAWLQPFGRLIGAERHAGQCTRTLRVCLEGFQRFDLVFIPASALRNPSAWDQILFLQPYRVVWSRLPELAPDLKPNLEALIASPPSPEEFQNISSAEIERMADAFWFKAAAAITKVVRNDLLIGLHLTLDLARDCLVLQMMRRDRVKKTKIHRTGGWGNELAARLAWDGQESSPVKIIALITRSCEAFDELALALSPDYTPRGPHLFAAIERARAACNQPGVSIK